MKVMGTGFQGSAYSSITLAELCSGQGPDEKIIDRLLDQIDEIPARQHVAEEAGLLVASAV
jgi:hypothetical protein